jgi:hypothetical protein
MAKKSKVARRRRAFQDVGTQISAFVGVGVFIVIGLMTLDNNPNAIYLAGAGAVVAFVGMELFFRFVIRRTVKSRESAALDFDDVPSEPAAKPKRGDEFEREVAKLIEQTSSKSKLTQLTQGEGGIDVKVLDAATSKLVGVIKCAVIGEDSVINAGQIQALNKARLRFGVSVAYFITNGYFSDDSHDVAKQLNIRLIDGDGLTSLRRKAVSRA